jgi:hypothetical protein
MSRGFITIGIDTDLDKVKYSYTLALSIKNSDPTAEVCLVVDKDKSDLVPKKYFDAFDYIVELPFGNTGHKDGFHGSNIWQLRFCTPFEETIYLDYDTLFVNVDVPLLWEQFQDYDIAMPAIARTYRNRIANKSISFEIENSYDLPTLYSNLIYFKYDAPLANEWFKMADPIFQNWRDVYNVQFTEKKPQTFDKTILCNLVTHYLDAAKDISVVLNNFYDMHSRSQYLWNGDISVNFTDTLNYWTTPNNIIIENSAIRSGIIHYRDEQFISKELVNDFKNIISKEKIRSEAE